LPHWIICSSGRKSGLDWQNKPNGTIGLGKSSEIGRAQHRAPDGHQHVSRVCADRPFHCRAPWRLADDGDLSRLSRFAAELASLQPDLIVVASTAAALGVPAAHAPLQNPSKAGLTSRRGAHRLLVGGYPTLAVAGRAESVFAIACCRAS